YGSASAAIALRGTEASAGGSDGWVGCWSQLAISGAAMSRAVRGNRGIGPPGRVRNLLCNPGATCFVTARDFPILLALGSHRPNYPLQRGAPTGPGLQWDG